MSEGKVDQKGSHSIRTFFSQVWGSPTFQRYSKNPLVIGIVAVVVIAGAFFGIRYWQDASSKIYIENSEIVAPVTSYSPNESGTLREIYVKVGDQVTEGQPLFKVSSHIVVSLTPGIVTAVQNTPGQMETPQSAVVKLYDPASLRLIGHLQEDQGLRDVRAGQNVTFTLDAFGGKQYRGSVETVTPISDTSSVVFSISDKRQEKQFGINVIFDVAAYPEIKNGMSAKMWVHK